MASSLAFAGFNPIFISNRVDTGTQLFKSKSVPLKTDRSSSSSKQAIIVKPTLPRIQNSHSSETSEESNSETAASPADISIERTPDIVDQSAIYLLLTKQRDEAIAQYEKMENRIQEKEIAFALKLSSFKKQLKQYKHANVELMRENVHLKDQLSILAQKLSSFELSNEH